MAWPHELSRILLIGIGSTAVMDAWLLLLRRLGVPGLNFALLGRWVGHLWRGQLVHAAIARAPAVPGERAWGWAAHYAAYSTRSRTPFRCDGGQHSAVMADAVPR